MLHGQFSTWAVLSDNSSPGSLLLACASVQEAVEPPSEPQPCPPGCTVEGHVIWLSLFIVTLWRLDLRDGELFPFWNLWYEQIKQTFSDMTHLQQLGINHLGGRKGKFRRKKMPGWTSSKLGVGWGERTRNTRIPANHCVHRGCFASREGLWACHLTSLKLSSLLCKIRLRPHCTHQISLCMGHITHLKPRCQAAVVAMTASK